MGTIDRVRKFLMIEQDVKERKARGMSVESEILRRNAETK
jgi:hypothetical protein